MKITFRSDCLRKISKNQADFSVFTPEDLVTASNSDIELLVTNELRFTQGIMTYVFFKRAEKYNKVFR